MTERTVRLFLDDFRDPAVLLNYMPARIGTKAVIYSYNDWLVVRAYDAFTRYIIEHGMPLIISFDHDLYDEHYYMADAMDWQIYYSKQDREMTGYDCAKWLIDYCITHNERLPDCIIHSMNAAGTENIKALLKSHKE